MSRRLSNAIALITAESETNIDTLDDDVSVTEWTTRISTFDTMRWFGKPLFASPFICAMWGWSNIDVNLLHCSLCNVRLSYNVPATFSFTRKIFESYKFKRQLVEGHADGCPCHVSSISTNALIPGIHTLVSQFQRRLDSFLRCEVLPVAGRSFDDATEHLDLQPIYARMDLGENGENAIKLAVCGWQNDAALGCVHCALCNRHVSTEQLNCAQYWSAGDAQSVRKKHKSSSKFMDVFAEHRRNCPFLLSRSVLKELVNTSVELTQEQAVELCHAADSDPQDSGWMATLLALQ